MQGANIVDCFSTKSDGSRTLSSITLVNTRRAVIWAVPIRSKENPISIGLKRCDLLDAFIMSRSQLTIEEAFFKSGKIRRAFG